MDDLYKTLYQYWITMTIRPTATADYDRGRLYVIFEKGIFCISYLICESELEEKDLETILLDRLGCFLNMLQRKGMIDQKEDQCYEISRF